MPHTPPARRATRAPRAFSRPSRPFPSFLVAVLALAAAPVSAQQQSAAGEVRLVVTVTDAKGRYLSGLSRSHFSILEGKVAREITAFDSAEAPASVGVLVDVSPSVGRAGIEATKLALGRMFLAGHPENQYFVAEFNTRENLLTDWTNDASRLADAIGRVGTARGNVTNAWVYDACAWALDKLAGGAHARRALVVVTDGGDNGSRTSFKNLQRKIQTSGVLVYPVGVAERNGPSVLDVGGRAILAEFAERSGGAAFFPQTRGELIATGERIAVELRHQYVVGFKADDAAGAAGPEWRKIRIKVASPWKGVSLKARSREGYFRP